MKVASTVRRGGKGTPRVSFGITCPTLPVGSPRLQIRIPEDMFQWLRDYAKRQNKAMAQIIKELLERDRTLDERAQHKVHKEALDG